MKITVIGLRGFPDIQGGIETHCEELYPRLVKLGADITVVRRSCFISSTNNYKEFRGVKFKDLPAFRIKGFEAALHSLMGIFYAYHNKCDIVHIHAIGPSIVIPIGKLLGLKIIVTHHGPDYDRDNWSSFAKFILKAGERFAAKWADKLIIISNVIKDLLAKEYNRTDTVLIYNGVNKGIHTKETSFLNELGIQKDKYILAVGRFVKEKRFHLLIRSFSSLNMPGYKLVIAGDADHPTPYSIELKQLAQKNNTILTGVVKGDKLNQLYSHAALFVLPSSHEGLPITLLEAMSYQRNILASNIPANLAVELPEKYYFQLDDTKDLAHKIKERLSSGEVIHEYDMSKYNWDTIALQTYTIYKEITGK